MGDAVVKLLLGAFIVGAIAYVAVALYMFAMQRSFLYHPDTSRVWPAGSNLPEMAEVSLRTDDGLDLLAWYKPAEAGPDGRPRPTVIYFHGNAGNRGYLEHKARPLIDAGYGVLLPDYRGYGGNPGTPSEEGLRLDALAARQFVLDQGVAADRIVYHGESLGSGVAVWLASRHAPLGLILEAAFTSIVDVGKRQYWWLPVRLAARDRYTSLRKITEVTAPLLSLHGERDALVPVLQGRLLHKAHPGPKRMVVFPDGLHADLYEHGAGQVVLDWLAGLDGTGPENAGG